MLHSQWVTKTMKPLNRKLPIVIFSQDVDNKLEAPLCANIVNMFAVRINIIMKTTRCLEVALDLKLCSMKCRNLGFERLTVLFLYTDAVSYCI